MARRRTALPLALSDTRASLPQLQKPATATAVLGWRHAVERLPLCRHALTRPYAFTFWESAGGGPDPGYISLCLESQRRNLATDFEHVHLDLSSAEQWVPEHAMLWEAAIPDKQGRSASLEGRRLALYTGMLRVALLRRHGGIWVDADTLLFPRFGLLAPLVEEYDLLCGESSGGSISNAILGARRDSSFIASYWAGIERRIAERAESGEVGTQWGEFGFRMLRTILMERRGDSCWIAPWGVLDTVDAHLPRPTFTPGATIEDSLSPAALDLSIFNNATEHDVRRRTAPELLAEDSLFAAAHRVATGAVDHPEHLSISTPDQLRALNSVHVIVRRLQRADHLREKLAVARDRNAELLKRLAVARDRNAELRASVESARSRAARLEAKLEHRAAQLRAARERLRRQRRKVELLKRRVAELERPFPRLRQLVRRKPSGASRLGRSRTEEGS